jgi:hypothetical protein
VLTSRVAAIFDSKTFEQNLRQEAVNEVSSDSDFLLDDTNHLQLRAVNLSPNCTRHLK